MQSVTLLAVSKTFGVDAIAEAHAAGQRRFGENYVQEALEKIAALAALGAASRMAPDRPAAEQQDARRRRDFDWVHSVDRLKVAERLSAQRPAGLAPLSVCLQVNVSGEASKSGVAPAEVADARRARSRALPRLRLRGLMAIPEAVAGGDLAAQRAPAPRPARALRSLRGDGLALDTLSAGMSDDLEAAILEGATMVRIGSAIFGRRPAA